MSDQFNHDDEFQLPAKLEALLFVAPGAVTLGQLASALDTTTRQIEYGLEVLEKRYKHRPGEHGLRLQRFQSKIQLTTAPELAPIIERYLDLDSISRLSRAALEALAIVAYQQPVSRPEVDSIRGVNSDAVLKTLLSKGLIEEVGRAERPGRPILYSTTTDFLQYFGLNTLDELPPLNLDKPTVENLNSYIK